MFELFDFMRKNLKKTVVEVVKVLVMFTIIISLIYLI